MNDRRKDLEDFLHRSGLLVEEMIATFRDVERSEKKWKESRKGVDKPTKP